MAEITQEMSELAARIIVLAQSRLTADLRFLSSSLERLYTSPVNELPGLLATDGRSLYYSPAYILRYFKKEGHPPNRCLLHLILHCLLGHPFQRQEKDNRLWSIACDMSVEEIIHQLEIPSCTAENDAAQSERLLTFRELCPHMTAEEIYNFLLERQYDAETLRELQKLYERDLHVFWYLNVRKGSAAQKGGKRINLEDQAEVSEEPVEELSEQGNEEDEDQTEEEIQKRRMENTRKEWKQLARQAKADLQTFSYRHGKRAGALMDGLSPITFEECDYGEFLRRFGAENEVMQLSDDAFDLIYYTYGLKTYGNIPLIEPLEFKDDKRIREFVIAIDTSGSVQGEIVQDFLQRTCNILRQSGSFTTQVEIYLIQCDAEVQQVERLTNLDQLEELIPRLKLRGFGGTDFRPVFEYVDRLIETKVLTELNGLIYFTDGVGTYPDKAPDYKTAFIFNRDDYISPHVPPWAIRAVLTSDNIRMLKNTET